MVPPLVDASRKAGKRVLIVCREADRLSRIDRSLWDERPESFLAHGHAGEDHAARQPTLLSPEIDSANGAPFVIVADGIWRDGMEAFERIFFLFDDEALQRARECWRMLDGREGLVRNFWKQEGGKWNKQA